jgi:hypothetical protein
VVEPEAAADVAAPVEARPTLSTKPKRPGGRPKPQSQLTRLRIRAEAVMARLQAFQGRVPRLIALLRNIYYPIALLLVAYIGYQALRKIDLSTVRWGPMVAAYFFALIWWLSLSMGWSMLTREGYHVGPMRAWCKTQVARYVPGGFWAPVARATTVTGRVRDRVAAVFAENVIVLCIALGVGGLWACIHRPLWLPLIAVAVLPMIGIRWLERRSKVTRRAVLRTSMTYAVGFVAYGISGLLAQIAVTGLQRPTYPLYVAAATCIAWAVGLVVVFAPGGVGVRELVYIWMLSGLYPSADVKAAAIVSRLVAVAAEFTVLAIISRPQFHRRRGEPADVLDLADDDVATQPS